MKSATQLGELFKKARRKLRVSQRFMAKVVGVNPSNWARFETGERWPSLRALNAIKKLLKISEDQPLSQKGELNTALVCELTPKEQEHLHAKWWLEVYELKNQLAQKKKVYERYKQQRLVQAEELQAISVELQPMQDVLKELKRLGADPDIVKSQQKWVDELVSKQNKALTSRAFRSNVELKVLEAELELLEIRKEYLEGRLAVLKKTG